MRRYEKQFCEIHNCAHWVQMVGHRNYICHGEAFLPTASPEQYTRYRNGGLEICEKATAARTIRRVELVETGIDWLMAEEANRENQRDDVAWLDLGI